MGSHLLKGRGEGRVVDMSRRRGLKLASMFGAAALLPLSGEAATRRFKFDRAGYDRYVRLMNASDPRVVDYYADDIKFVMNIHGKAAVAQFYANQRPYVKESLEVLLFCSDASGAAAEVRSQLHCIRDCDDTAIFGRTLKAGEVQRTHGYLFYALNPDGLIAEIKGPPPELIQPWRLEAG
jgi:ketosteroid isomerase-like protein